MKSYLLILNADKTEIIHFASRFNNNIEKLDSLRVGGPDIIPHIVFLILVCIKKARVFKSC